MAVARSASTPCTPTLASTAVSPANTAESSAQDSQFMAASFFPSVVAPVTRVDGPRGRGTRPGKRRQPRPSGEPRLDGSGWAMFSPSADLQGDVDLLEGVVHVP